MSACSLKQRPTSITTAIKVVEHHLIESYSTKETKEFNAAAVRVGGLATRQRKPARAGWSGEGVIVGEHEAEVGESSLADGVARDTL